MSEPLVPPEVNLRGLPWMRLDTERLLNSDLFLLSSGDELKAALSLWCRSWSQIPAGSLPDDDRLLAPMAGASSAARWKRLKPMAMRGWIKADDGRLYHPVVAEQVMVAWKERLDYQNREGNRREREERYREEHKQLREELRALGIRAAWNAPIDELRQKLEASKGEDQSSDGRAPPTDLRRTYDEPTTRLRRDYDAPPTAKTGRDGTVKASTSDTPARTGVSEGSAPDLARALHGVGFPDCAPTLPDLVAAKREGVTVEEISSAAISHAGKSLAYVIAAARGKRQDALDRAAKRGDTPPAAPVDPAVLVEAKARDELDRRVIDATKSWELGVITAATRDERIAAARLDYAAAVATPEAQEA